MNRRARDPADYQVRVCYMVVGERFHEDFWTTAWIAMGLINNPRDSQPFKRALRALNQQLRYKAGLPKRGDDYHNEVLPCDIVGQPELAGKKVVIEEVQQAFSAKGCLKEKTKKTVFILPPIDVVERKPQKKKGNPDQEELFPF